MRSTATITTTRICRTGGFRVNVNLIRYNEVAGMPFGRPFDHDGSHAASVTGHEDAWLGPGAGPPG